MLSLYRRMDRSCYLTWKIVMKNKRIEISDAVGHQKLMETNIKQRNQTTLNHLVKFGFFLDEKHFF